MRPATMVPISYALQLGKLNWEVFCRRRESERRFRLFGESEIEALRKNVKRWRSANSAKVENSGSYGEEEGKLGETSVLVCQWCGIGGKQNDE